MIGHFRSPPGGAESHEKRPGRRRTTHRIRPNASGALPSLRVYVDTEAVRTPLDPEHERQTLRFGWAVREHDRTTRKGRTTTEEWFRFETPSQFFEWLADHTYDRRTTYVYAHNWGYDAALLSLQTQCEAHGWKVTEYVSSHHFLWLTAQCDQRRIIFIDTLNYFATSLAVLGEQIGWPKLLMPDDCAPSEEWDAYCQNDVKLIQYAMTELFKLIKENDLGKYRKTAASQAMGCWRHRFMRDAPLILDDDYVSELERRAYHGGPPRVFYDLPVYETVFVLDVNSMFPSMMLQHLFPLQVDRRGQHCMVAELAEKLKTRAVIAEVTLSTEEPCYPVKHEGRLVFPVGTFHTVLSTPELAYAVAHHHIVSVDRWVTYKTAPLFAEYVQFFYGKRLEYKAIGNVAFAYLCKLLLNSLYGKFGQRGMYWETCPEDDPTEQVEWIGQCEPGGVFLHHRRRFGIIQHRLDDGEAYESFPAIAAHVTAYARMHLWSLMQQAGHRNVYYCDTDSLYTNASGYLALSEQVDNVLLGKLKLEARYPGLHCYAPKDYHWIDGRKAKGVRHSAHRVSPEEYAALFPDNTRTLASLTAGEWECFRQEQFESYDAVLASGRDGEIIVSTVYKVLKRENHQSVGRGVGWRQPIRLSLPEAE